MKPIHGWRCRCCAPRHPDTERRQVLLGLAALAALAPLAACKQDSAAKVSVAPAEIRHDTACELDGMLLADYPGPKGQIHYADSPEPLFYCDTVELLNTLLVPEQVRTVTAVYVQDVGKTDWDNPKGAWIDARQAIYVHGSKRRGSMGPTLASFSDEAAARTFADEYGGKILRVADIRPEMLDLRGGAHMDHSM